MHGENMKMFCKLSESEVRDAIVNYIDTLYDHDVGTEDIVFDVDGNGVTIAWLPKRQSQ